MGNKLPTLLFDWVDTDDRPLGRFLDNRIDCEYPEDTELDEQMERYNLLPFYDLLNEYNISFKEGFEEGKDYFFKCNGSLYKFILEVTSDNSYDELIDIIRSWSVDYSLPDYDDEPYLEVKELRKIK